MRRGEPKNLVGEATLRALQNARRPVLWHMDEEWVGFAGPLGRLDHIFECGAVRDDARFVGRERDPPIERRVGECGQPSF